MPEKKVLIVAGEASGDQHGARLLAELEQRIGSFVAYGLGGDGIKEAGTELIADVSEISVVGVAEVLSVLPRARKIFRQLVERVRTDPPDVAILIDFPEFNLRLAPALRKLGVKVAFYVSPQVWAWRKGRVKSMARSIDKMLVFFPFERDFYKGHVDTTHVGHPIVDQVPQLPQAWDRKEESGSPEGSYRIALLPGSRQSEINRILPVLLESADALRESFPALEVLLIEAPTADADRVTQILESSALPVQRVAGANRFGAVASAHAALCASGTATLEVGLLRTPMVVVYRVGLFSYWLGRWLVDVPFISLVNLVLGKKVVPELIQSDAKPEKISGHVRQLLGNEQVRNQMMSELAGLRSALGESGASGRAAVEIVELLNRGTSPA